MILTKNISPKLATEVRNIQNHIGNTPLWDFSSLSPNPNVRILGKLEWHQLGGSIKARAAYQIIRSAIASGQLDEGKTLLDATSGNTGIAFAAIGAKLGIPVALCLPKNASDERKTTLKALGAELILTSPYGGTDDAQLEAKKLFAEHPEKYFYADQYANENNWKAHYLTTGNEIFSQTQEEITHFVAGLGTSGTFTGTTRRLRELNPDIQAISLQPDAALHGLEGWKHMETAIQPQFYDPSLADQNLAIDTLAAYDLIPEISRNHGLMVSPSSAANLAGAIAVARNLDHGTIVTVLPDSAERYGEVIRQIFNPA